LRVGFINLRGRLLAEALMLHVTDDSDDFPIKRRSLAVVKALADGVT